MREDQVRRLLHDAVADVEPTRGFEDLGASRESGAPGPRARVLPALVAAALVTALALGGTTWLTSRGGDPTAASEPSSTVQDEGGSVRAVVVQQTPAGPRLVTERRPLEPGADPLQTAVTETLADATLRSDLAPAWPGSDFSADVRRAGDTVLVQLEDPGTGSGDVDPASARLLPQAVVWAVAIALDDPEALVQITLNGADSAEFFDTDLTRALRPEAGLDLLAPVFLTSVAGEPARSPLTVEGLAAAFEGTVVWELRQDDQVVEQGFATAQECCTPSPFTLEIDAPPGDYELRVAETDPSDGEGNPPYVAREQVTVGE